MSAKRFMLLFALLVAGNLLYQWAGDGHYVIAIERSYFQGVALLMAWAWSKVRPEGATE